MRRHRFPAWDLVMAAALCMQGETGDTCCVMQSLKPTNAFRRATRGGLHARKIRPKSNFPKTQHIFKVPRFFLARRRASQRTFFRPLQPPYEQYSDNHLPPHQTCCQHSCLVVSYPRTLLSPLQNNQHAVILYQCIEHCHQQPGILPYSTYAACWSSLGLAIQLPASGPGGGHADQSTYSRYPQSPLQAFRSGAAKRFASGV